MAIANVSVSLSLDISNEGLHGTALPKSNILSGVNSETLELCEKFADDSLPDI